MNFCYLDLPALSEEIERDTLNQIRSDNLLTFRRESNIGSLFKMYHIREGLTRSFLEHNFGSKLFFRIQTQISGHQPIHRDPSRTFAINYYLDLGGDNCVTNFYKEVYDTIPTESHQIKLRSWCRLNVTTPHNVTGITGTRIAITICDG